MTDQKPYKCVNCGQPAAALYKYYGPSVLKLTKCEFCNCIVDKYVEYDAVIVMIDLILISREAQRHIIYNTEFKPYWKLLIILMMLETYGVWRKDSLITIVIDSMCKLGKNGSDTNSVLPDVKNVTHNSHTWVGATLDYLSSSVPESWRENCWAWTQEDRADDTDLFIWEKNFYIQFIATFMGIAVFLLSTFLLTKISLFSKQNQVPVLTQIKAFTLANMSSLFTLPMLVWGNSDTSMNTRTIHYTLVAAYNYVVFYHVFSVVFGSRMLQPIMVLTMSYYTKFQTTFYTTPLVRSFL